MDGGRYTVGGYAGPSEQIPANPSGVALPVPGVFPVNRTPDRSAHSATPRQLPWYGTLLIFTLVLFGYYRSGIPVVRLFAVDLALCGGLVLWVRAL